MRTCIWKLSGILVFIILYIGSNQVFANPASKVQGESGIDLGVFSGATIVDLHGESFGAKVMPTVGVSFFPWIQLVNLFYLGAEVSMQYTFRSDYRNYYYYNAFGTFSVIPNIHLLLRGNTVRFLFLVGGGLCHSFSDHFTLNYPVGCIGTGIRFKSGFISSILLTYNHSFTESFQYFETIRLSANIRLLHNTGE
jgi:hypothetical protein